MIMFIKVIPHVWAIVARPETLVVNRMESVSPVKIIPTVMMICFVMAGKSARAVPVFSGHPLIAANSMGYVLVAFVMRMF